MDRLLGVCLFMGSALWSIVLNVIAAILYVDMTTGPVAVTPPGAAFVRHYWLVGLLIICVWSALTGCGLFFRWKRRPVPPPERPPSTEERSIQNTGENSITISGNIEGNRDVHIGNRYEDASLGTLMRGAMHLDMQAISQVARMQGAMISGAKAGIDFHFDSQGNVIATVDVTKVPVRVSFGLKDPASIVPGGDVITAIRNADTVLFPREQMIGLEIAIGGENVAGTLSFDALIFQPLPIGQATNCWLMVETIDARIDNLLLEVFKLDSGAVQITNKNQSDQPFRIVCCVRLPGQHDSETCGKADGDFSSSFDFNLAKARYVHQVLAYHDILTAMAETRRIFIRDTATGALRYILRNSPVVAGEEDGQARLIHVLRCAQHAAGHMDLRLPQEYDDETRAKLAFIADVVTTGKAAVHLGQVQTPEGLGIPTPLVEEILAQGRPIVQFPLSAVSDNDLIDLLGAQIDLGGFHVLFPPLKMLITLQELQERLAANPQARQVNIPWETIPTEPEKVLLYYPRFLQNNWEDEAKTEIAVRMARSVKPRRGTRGATYGRIVRISWNPQGQTVTRAGSPKTSVIISED